VAAAAGGAAQITQFLGSFVQYLKLKAVLTNYTTI
jgi:hypothetical protein